MAGERIDGEGALRAELEVLLGGGAQLIVGRPVPVAVDLDMRVEVDRVDTSEIDAVFVLFDWGFDGAMGRSLCLRRALAVGRRRR